MHLIVPELQNGKFMTKLVGQRVHMTHRRCQNVFCTATEVYGPWASHTALLQGSSDCNQPSKLKGSPLGASLASMQSRCCIIKQAAQKLSFPSCDENPTWARMLLRHAGSEEGTAAHLAGAALP